MNAEEFKTMTDEQLAEALKNGRKEAMTELYSRYFMLVYNKCLSFTKNTDDASDLAQDVMVRVLEKIDSFKGESRFSTWLYAVTFNYCTDHVRKAKRKYVQSLETVYEISDSVYSEIEDDANEIKEEVAELAFLDISDEDRQILLMKYQERKSIREIQVTYNLSASAVKMRLMRARSKAVVAYNNNLVPAA